MTNLRKYFGFRYSNNRKMFSRNQIKRAPAVAREGCGGSGAPGAGLRGARGTPLQDFPERRLQGFPERRLQDFPERRLQGFPGRRCRTSRSAVCGFPGAPSAGFPGRRSGLFSEPSGAPLRGSFGQGPDRFPDISSDMFDMFDMFPDIFPDIFSGHCSGRIRSAPGPGKEAERGQPHARGGAEG